jgi:hypothetical protein
MPRIDPLAAFWVGWPRDSPKASSQASELPRASRRRNRESGQPFPVLALLIASSQARLGGLFGFLLIIQTRNASLAVHDAPAAPVRQPIAFMGLTARHAPHSRGPLHRRLQSDLAVVARDEADAQRAPA